MFFSDIDKTPSKWSLHNVTFYKKKNQPTQPYIGTWPFGNGQLSFFVVWLQTTDCEGLCCMHIPRTLVSISIQLAWVCGSLRKVYEGCRPQEMCEQMGLTEIVKAISEKAPMPEACSGLCPVVSIHVELREPELMTVQTDLTYFSHFFMICPEVEKHLWLFAHVPLQASSWRERIPHNWTVPTPDEMWVGLILLDETYPPSPAFAELHLALVTQL